MRHLPLVALCALAVSCVSRRVDLFTVDRVVDRGLGVGDVDLACQLGGAFTHVLAAPTARRNPPHRALAIADLTSALCAEADAWEAELAAGRAKASPAAEPAARVAAIKDARLAQERAHAVAAARFQRSWGHLVAEYGTIGDGCPWLRTGDELVYLLGLYAGVNALIHDKAAGGPLGVPEGVIAQVARGATCVEDADWWGVPSALQAACWAMIPGSEPEGVAPWAALDAAAAAGDDSGVRVGRALQVKINAIAGRDDAVAAALAGHAAALGAHPTDAEAALLDDYARRVSLHEADLIWTAAEGHRAPGLELPAPEPPAGPPGDDPFGGDPFGGDPFGGDDASDDASDDDAEGADASPDPDDAPDEETP